MSCTLNTNSNTNIHSFSQFIVVTKVEMMKKAWAYHRTTAQYRLRSKSCQVSCYDYHWVWIEY